MSNVENYFEQPAADNDNIFNLNGTWKIDGDEVTASATELNYADVTAVGTVEASKAVIVDANKDISVFRNVGVVNLDAGSSGVAGTVDVFPTTAANGKFQITATDQGSDITSSLTLDAQTQATALHLPDVNLSASYVGLSTAALTAAEMDVLDGATSTQNVASKAVILDSDGKLNTPSIGSGAVSASGLILGGGTSVAPLATSTADDKFIEIRAKTTATSGDNRLGYLRYDIGGAGASGECLRAYTDLTAAASTARGSHVSMQIDDTGYVTGLGVGQDSQIYVGDAAVAAGGTYAVNNSEIYSEGSSSDVSGVTSLAYFRAVNSGDATGAATVDAKAYLFDLSGFTSGATSLWYDNQGSAPANIEEWLKVKTPAGDRWLPLYNAVV